MTTTTTAGPTIQRESGPGAAPATRYLSGAERRGETRSPAPAPAAPSLVKDVLVLFASALALAAIGVGTYWVAWAAGRPAPVVPAPAGPAAPRPALLRTPAPAPRVAPARARVEHADLFFDVNRTRLRADAVAVLQASAATVREEPGAWRLLVQGHADGQGAPAYNLALAQRRAEAVRQFLVELGVPAGAIRVAAVGQGSALCDEPTAECQQLDRRVHLEMRRLPAPAAPTPTDPAAARPVTVPAAQIFQDGAPGAAQPPTR